MGAVENIITDNLPIWSSAVQSKSSSGRGTSSKRTLYGVKKLRDLILDLAVRGLLVPQDPNDEPASVLLENITAIKEGLVGEGKIKKQKPLSPLSLDELQFELPRGWKWVRLQDVSTYIQRGKSPKYSEEGRVKVISQKCVQSTGFDLAPARLIADESLSAYHFERFLLEADLIWNSTGTGTVGRIAVATQLPLNSVVGDSHVTIIRTIKTNSGFIKSYLSSSLIQERIDPEHEKALVSGSTKQVELNTSTVIAVPVPLPPLAEQRRIVAKVDELMALCDTLEQQQEDSIQAHETLVEALLEALTSAVNADAFHSAWQRISEHFDVLFTTEHSVEKLKETILQLAVMGKLVPQDPNDEPASELLKNIAAKKEQLVKEKLIKKQKPLTEITDEEKPFNLPRGWVWTTLSNLGTFSGGKTPSKNNSRYWGGSIPWVTPKDMKVNDIFGAQDKVTQLAIDDGLGLVDCESLLFVARSGILRRAFPVAITRVECTVNQDLKVLSLFDKKLSRYVHLMMKGFEGYILNNLTKIGTTVESLKFDEFSRHYFLLPPLVEQHRIVAKVDQLMALCDELRESLQQAQKTQIHLTDAVVENAL